MKAQKTPSEQETAEKLATADSRKHDQKRKSVTVVEQLQELAELSELEYNQVRKVKAKELDCPVSVLDKLVAALRKRSYPPSIIEDLTAWPSAVDGVALYHEIGCIIEKYIVLPQGGLHALGLWCMGTYAFDDFHIFPKLIFHSPEKRCGKSTALDVVEAISNRALFSSSITPAALFRVIDKYHPTLVIDEADTFISGRNDELIGIINSSHARNRAFVIRTVGDNHEPKQFSTWSPQAFASIKQLQDTIMDRSVIIELRRKTKDERTTRIRTTLKEELKPLRQKLLRWYQDTKLSLKAYWIEPETLNSDRAVDNWLPLYTIAHSISAECFDHCKNAYRLLNSSTDDPSIPLQLLEDIQAILNGHNYERIASRDLVEKLIDLEERPWCEWKRGQPMTQNSLAKLLDGFSIKSKQYRFGDRRQRGYEKEFFADSFSRYLSSQSDIPPSNHDSVTLAPDKAVSGIEAVTDNISVTDTKSSKLAPDMGCHGVTDGVSATPEDDLETVIV